jgi:hypothetical protein
MSGADVSGLLETERSRIFINTARIVAMCPLVDVHPNVSFQDCRFSDWKAPRCIYRLGLSCMFFLAGVLGVFVDFVFPETFYLST